MAINNFEKETHQITELEIEMSNYISSRISGNIGKDSAVTSNIIRKALLNKYDKNITGSRIRKMINFIRRKKDFNGCLVASSNGYYIERNKEQIEIYIESLRQRAEAINHIANEVEINMLKLD